MDEGRNVNAVAPVNGASPPGAVAGTPAASRRLVGVDAARGIALIGLMVIHILPSWNPETGDASLAWILFSGNSAALFALLAGVGLGLGTGGVSVHRGRRMTADRVGLLVRAMLIGLVGLTVSSVMPAEDPPAAGILVYYAAFFLLAVPFLHLGARALFLWAAGFALFSQPLMQLLWNRLPGTTSYNPTFHELATEPLGILSHLLVTGVYPALPYMAYVLAGLAVGRLDLRSKTVQRTLLVVGALLAAGAKAVSHLLLYGAGGYDRLLLSVGMDEELLWRWLVWGPEFRPEGTAWWLVITTRHTNTPFAIAFALGVGLATLGACLLIARRIPGPLGPLATMGAMTFTLYTAHLLALAAEVHYDEPFLWFLIHLVVAATFALAWCRVSGQGPLERCASVSVRTTRRLVAGPSTSAVGTRTVDAPPDRRTSTGEPGT